MQKEILSELKKKMLELKSLYQEDSTPILVTGQVFKNKEMEEIKEVIRNGEIIEEYPTDYPYPSCLVLGRTMNRRILHVVIGATEDKIWLVTVYEPDAEKWDRQFKCRKE